MRFSVRIIKRLIDIVFSLFILIMMSPFLLIIAVLIKLDSTGPIFFKQNRVKRCSKHLKIGTPFRPTENDIFKMYKFRTMTIDADSDTVAAISNDIRVTRIGKYLRSTRLDEIPNFINVLLGDMSIVGPRAEWVDLYYKIENQFPNIWERTRTVKPGITGIAQLSLLSNGGLDVDSDLVHALAENDIGKSEDGVRFKLYYDFAYTARLTSFWSFIKTDFTIMIKTPYVMFFKRNVI